MYSLLIMLAITACDKDEDIDTEKPQIDNSFADAFPLNCDTLYFGETFDLRLLFTDNEELGSYNISIHNNFDHHSHSTEVTECSMGAVKDAINPLVYIEDYDIADSLTVYTTDISILIPYADGNDLYDEGDYHFFVSLTDKEGWSDQKGLSLKILYR